MRADLQQLRAGLGISSPAVVTIANGPAPPVENALDVPYAVVGRDPSCHIRLDNPEISGRHALLLQFGCGVYGADLGSRTGVTWEGGTDSSGWLSPQASARIGPYVIRQFNQPEQVFEPQFEPLRDRLAEGIPAPMVVFETPGLEGRTFILNRRLTIVGRGGRSRLQLCDCPDVSRGHCAIIVIDGGVWVIDLLSRTGTRIDGRSIGCGVWHPGETLELGRHRLRLLDIDEGKGPSIETVSASGDPDQQAELEECGQRLIRNQLLSEEEWSGFLREFGPFSVAAALQCLVDRGHLTPWQADRLAKRPDGVLMLEERYVLRRMISRGGMATVYEARDLRTRQTVAVKVPRRVPPLDANRRRFLREIAINARLDHGHIVRMRDVGPKGRFLVLDFVDGPSLKDIVRKTGPQAAADVARWMIQIADALEHAHGRSVVHRDVKPSNVLIDGAGWARLIDMGLARVTDEVCDDDADDEYQAGLTMAGQKLGTVQFMPPEQASGNPGTDGRSDVYGIGATMYTLLAGTPPFGDRKTIAEVLLAHLRDEPPMIANVDRDLFAIVMRAMAKNPADRFPTPAALGAALRDWLHQVAPPAGEAARRLADGRAQLDQERKRFEADAACREHNLSLREQQLESRLAEMDQLTADRDSCDGPAAARRAPAN